ADRVLPREQRHDAVPAEGDAAVRRGAVLERLQQEAELLLRLLLVDAHQAEDALLDGLVMDADGAAADLIAVADDVVRVGQRGPGIGVEGVQELGLRRGEGMVDRGPGTAAHRDVPGGAGVGDRKSTRLNSSHVSSSYAVFCLEKKIVIY